MDRFLKKLTANKIECRFDYDVPLDNVVRVVFTKDVFNSGYIHDLCNPLNLDTEDIFIGYLDKFLRQYEEFRKAKEVGETK